MQPFDSYPQHGRALLGIIRGSNCRHDYCLRFMQKTGQTSCAYCGRDLVHSYENWLNMELDHVIPTSVCRGFGLPADWIDDCANRVLACSACNGFMNRYKPSLDVVCPVSIEEFFNLRDHIFAERKVLILEKHKEARAFFNRRLWEERM